LGIFDRYNSIFVAEASSGLRLMLKRLKLLILEPARVITVKGSSDYLNDLNALNGSNLSIQFRLVAPNLL
jgi:hypothetical protein